MEYMDGWDFALLIVVGYVAVSVLVRLMAGHRDQLVARLRQEMKQHQAAQVIREAKAAKTVQGEGQASPDRRRRAG